MRLKRRTQQIEKMITLLAFMCVLLSSPLTVSAESHSLWWLSTYIKGKTPFPKFSVTLMLDDLTVGHYNSETEKFIPQDNTTNEDDIVMYVTYAVKNELQPFVMGSFTFKNYTGSPQTYQVMSHCELLDNDKPGQMITKVAFSGSSTDEMHFWNNNFTYMSSKEMATLSLEIFKWHQETTCYPRCISTLRNYLKRRRTQVNKKVKPRIRLFKKANPDSGGFVVSCLATGFYPRHINLTLLRDGQPVPDYKVTGGDLLPNGDGTYQMRKNLEIIADKHKYTCSARHLSQDNRMTVDLEFDHREFKSLIPSVVAVLILVLLLGVAVVIWRKKNADSSDSKYSNPSTSEESMDMNPHG